MKSSKIETMRTSAILLDTQQKQLEQLQATSMLFFLILTYMYMYMYISEVEKENVILTRVIVKMVIDYILLGIANKVHKQ